MFLRRNQPFLRGKLKHVFLSNLLKDFKPGQEDYPTIACIGIAGIVKDNIVHVARQITWN